MPRIPGWKQRTLFEIEISRTAFPAGSQTANCGPYNAESNAGAHWKVHPEYSSPNCNRPGELAQSDYTHMGKLGITIAGQPFDHLIYQFVLTYSNWETGSICYSESFESLSEGLQAAL